MRVLPAFLLIASFTFVASHGPSLVDTGEVPIPTIYLGDRFFANPVTSRGDTLLLFLDTGDQSRVWERSAERVQMSPIRVNTTRGPVWVAPLPQFRKARTLPAPSLGLQRVMVTAPTDWFDTLMSVRTDGQLGTNWFADRLWTLDYPGRRMVLHHSRLPTLPVGAHPSLLGFPTDADGIRVGHSPGIVVEIDGDSLYMLFDTGATVWLTGEALTAINDGGQSERASSLAWGWLFELWRQRHPDWRVIPSADSLSHESLIEVPEVRIAGYKVGPVWFRSLKSINTAPAPRPEGVPLLGTRVSGTIGGNVLREFVIQLDYPRGQAWFLQRR